MKLRPPFEDSAPQTLRTRHPGLSSGAVVEDEPKPTFERRPARIEDEFLMPPAQHWLEALPKGVRPIHLQRLFPRICNGIQRRWKTPPQINAYLAEKEMSERPDRRGFPPLIKEELLAIRMYWTRQQAAHAAAQRASTKGGVSPTPIAPGSPASAPHY